MPHLWIQNDYCVDMTNEKNPAKKTVPVKKTAPVKKVLPKESNVDVSSSLNSATYQPVNAVKNDIKSTISTPKKKSFWTRIKKFF